MEQQTQQFNRGDRVVDTYYGRGAGVVLHLTGDEEGKYKSLTGTNQVWVKFDNSSDEGEWFDVSDLVKEGE